MKKLIIASQHGDFESRKDAFNDLEAQTMKSAAKRFLQYMRSEYSDIMKEIDRTGDLSDQTKTLLDSAIFHWTE